MAWQERSARSALVHAQPCFRNAAQAYNRALKCCKPGVEADQALQPKVYVNLGITQEAEGLLMSACDHYRWAA